MSWLGRNKKSAQNLRANGTSPTPTEPATAAEPRTGLLAIYVEEASGLELPPGAELPAAVQKALASEQAKAAASASPSSVTQHRLASRNRHNR